MYHLKQRVIAFAGGIFFMGLAAGISYLGMYKLTEYLSYPDVVNFSFWVFFAAAFFFFFFPLLAMLFPVVFTGKQISVTSGKKLLKVVFIILGLTVLGMLSFQKDTQHHSCIKATPNVGGSLQDGCLVWQKNMPPSPPFVLSIDGPRFFLILPPDSRSLLQC